MIKNDEFKKNSEKRFNMGKRINGFSTNNFNFFTKSAPNSNNISKSVKKKKLYKFNFMERNSIHMILILSILALILTLFISSVMKFKKVEVIGNHDLSKAAVLASTGINKNVPSWQLLSEQRYFAKRAQENPQIKKIEINYLNMQIAQIKVEENIKVGLVNKDNRNYYILSNGSLIPNQDANKNPQNLPTYENFPNNQTIKNVAIQFGGISKALQHSISDVIWSPDKEADDKLTLIMDDGNTVLIKASDIKKKLKYYPGMVVQTDKGGTFNFQVGNYFRQY